MHDKSRESDNHTDYMTDTQYNLHQLDGGKFKPWTIHKLQSKGIVKHYLTNCQGEYGESMNNPYYRYALRVGACSDQLGFDWSDTEVIAPSGLAYKPLKFKYATYCRVRHCPICQWRRSMMWRAKFIQLLPDLLEQHPAGRWLFLTLTIRNCDVKDLRATITTMNDAWKKLTKRKEFKDVLGWIRTTELTRNAKDNTAHPHFHVLLLVKSTYFSKNYVSQNQWTSAWQNSLKIDYTPIVNVKAVKDRRKKKGVLFMATGAPECEKDAVMAAALETLKYAVKPADMLADKDWFLEMAKQTCKLRFVASGGLLKDVLKVIDYKNDAQSGEKTTEEPQPADTVFYWQNDGYWSTDD